MAGADWNTPSLSSTYSDFLTLLKARDFDAISLCYSGHPTNPQTGMISYLRASDVLEEYNGSAWVTKLLSLAGGGTGAATAAGARTNLGLGTIATQAASGVGITGGSITGLATFSTAGAATIGGGITAGSGGVGIVDGTGKIPALSSTYLASLSGANLTNLNGSNIASGTVAPARLGTGSPSSANFLRGDGSWQTVSAFLSVQKVDFTTSASPGNQDFSLGTTLTNYLNAFISGKTGRPSSGAEDVVFILSNTQVRVVSNGNATRYIFYVVEVSL